MLYCKAGLCGFLASTILFMVLSHPVDIGAQIRTLLIFEGVGIAAAMLLIPLLRRKARIQFDLLTRTVLQRPRATLKLVHSRD